MKRFFLLIAVLAMVLSACAPKLSPQSLAETYVAETQAAASPTPLPSSTPTETLEPTATPTEIPTATPTLEPTFTPTVTPVPGPISLTDDFSNQSDIWGDCAVCDWADGGLYLGPFPAKDNDMPNFIVCEGCGQPGGYRLSVEIQYIDGPTDRGYGILLRDNEDESTFLEIDPWQRLLIWRWDKRLHTWDVPNRGKWNSMIGMVKPGTAVNQIEVIYKPKADSSTADLYVYVNGRNAFVLFNQPADPGHVGLEVGFHAQKVVFDNFKFEELEPEGK